jgi:N-succinyldiaminopimelate aminotransferase
VNPLLGRLHRYPFERLAELLADVTPAADKRHIPLSIGEPKHQPPAFIGAALCGALETLGTYPVALGLAGLREAIAVWLTKRFELAPGSVDPERMILPVNGTREGLFSFVQAAVNPRADSLVMMPNPFYQIYEGAALLAGAQPVYLDTTAENGFLPDLEAVDDAHWRRCAVLFLCSPGNPTGAVMDETYLQRAIALADRHDFVIASDECYADIYLDEAHPPPGLLQACRAAGRDDYRRCVVFHSLSKRSSVPGLRSGFVAGDASIMQAYRLYRTYHGCAVPLATQLASVPAWRDEAHVEDSRQLYQRKFEAVMPILGDALEVQRPPASFYLWPRTPIDPERFTRGLFAEQHVTVLPGSYLSRVTPAGDPGADRIRISLVAAVDECVEAAHRIRAYCATL